MPDDDHWGAYRYSVRFTLEDVPCPIDNDPIVCHINRVHPRHEAEELRDRIESDVDTAMNVEVFDFVAHIKGADDA